MACAVWSRCARSVPYLTLISPEPCMDHPTVAAESEMYSATGPLVMELSVVLLELPCALAGELGPVCAIATAQMSRPATITAVLPPLPIPPFHLHFRLCSYIP